MNDQFLDAVGVEVGQPRPVITYQPITFDVPGRPVPLQVKVSLPRGGNDDLPVILLSHGHGRTNFLASYRGYAPLADFWAAHGFVVIQPTHLDAAELGLRDSDLPDAPTFWRDRVLDMRTVLDRLGEIEDVVPELAGRVDRERVAAVGHSLGAGVVSLLLGMQVRDPEDRREKDLADPRIKVGVMLAPPGVRDEHLGPVAERFPWLKWIDFDQMHGAGLVIVGDADLNPAFSDRLSYRWDAFTRSPGTNKTLLTFHGAEHILGGVSGYDAVETTDENPRTVATLRAMAWAYLRSQLYPTDTSWQSAVTALRSGEHPIATVETK